MYNKKLAIVFICIVIALAIIASIYFKLGINSSDKYSVVYLTSGEVYVGKLSSFPRLTLTDAYLIQIVKDQAGSNFQLAPLSETIWSPQKLYLNYDNVIFSGPINDTSQVVQAIKKNATPK